MEPSQLPNIELIQGPRSEAPVVGQVGRSRRLLVFAVVFTLIAGAGLAWNYSRAAVYRTSATVLTVKPKAVDTRSEEADVEHVTIQGRALMGEPVLEKVTAAVRAERPGIDVTGDYLRTLLSLVPVEETNLIELRAQGPDPLLLQLAVNSWAKAYEDLRQGQIAQIKTETLVELEEEQAALQQTIQERQVALARFRERHDIVSLEGADNRAPAKLKGLNQSLNKARERLVEAKSTRAAIMEAVAQGKIVVPKDQRAVLAAKELEAQKLRERLASLHTRYTQAYLDRDPILKALPGTLAEVEREVEGMRAIGQRQVIQETGQEVEAAERSSRALEAQLLAHQRDAQAFTGLRPSRTASSPTKMQSCSKNCARRAHRKRRRRSSGSTSTSTTTRSSILSSISRSNPKPSSPFRWCRLWKLLGLME